MGQAKRRGTFEQRKAEAIGQLYNPAAKTAVPMPVALLADGPCIPRRRPRPFGSLAVMATMAAALGPWPTERSKYRNDR